MDAVFNRACCLQSCAVLISQSWDCSAKGSSVSCSDIHPENPCDGWNDAWLVVVVDPRDHAFRPQYSSCYSVVDRFLINLYAVQAKAKSVGAPLTVVPSLEEYEGGADLELGLAGQHQRSNAALAICLAAAWEAERARQLRSSGVADAVVQAEAAERRAHSVAGRQVPHEYREGLRACHWPGRAQVKLYQTSWITCMHAW